VIAGRYLLDSHILIWLDTGNDRLTLPVREKLRFAEQRYLSAATAWELSLKQAAGKLQLSASISSMLATFRLQELPVSIRHGERAATLPLHHSDPFDRMLVAQTLEENLILVTADKRMAEYAVPILFV
jgi:PIN domain nuclease of toxin-antitoxin system